MCLWLTGGSARSSAGIGLTVEAMVAMERGGLPAEVPSVLSMYEGLSPEDIEHLEMASGDESDDSSVDLENEPVQKLREAVLLQDVADIDKAERAREFQGRGDWIGELRMTSEQVCMFGCRRTLLCVRMQGPRYSMCVSVDADIHDACCVC
jgi:hypothetical protein